MAGVMAKAMPATAAAMIDLTPRVTTTASHTNPRNVS
jgi:hypothetical protein